MNVWNIINNISQGKQPEYDEQQYVPWLVTKAFSYYADTFYYATSMNRYTQLDKKLQFDFLFNSISKRRRFSKWSKAEGDLEQIMRVYQVNSEKAGEIARLLNKEQFAMVKELDERRHF